MMGNPRRYLPYPFFLISFEKFPVRAGSYGLSRRLIGATLCFSADPIRVICNYAIHLYILPSYCIVIVSSVFLYLHNEKSTGSMGLGRNLKQKI